MTRDDSVYLRHILDAISQVDIYITGQSRSDFHSNRLLQDGVIRQIEIIGEAAKRISEERRNQAPAIPWKDLFGMRNKLIHQYFGVDAETVWLTAVEDLPELKTELQKLLASLDGFQE